MVTLGPGMGFSRSRRKKTNATPFAPTHAPGLLAWYDASDSSSITHASNVISQWNDKSGTPVNIMRGALDVILSGTGIPSKNTVRGFDDSGYVVAETYMTAGTYLITTPDLAISSGTSLSLEWRYEMVGNSSSSPSSGIVNILGAGIFKR